MVTTPIFLLTHEGLSANLKPLLKASRQMLIPNIQKAIFKDRNMANLDDITGWREELLEYHRSPEFKLLARGIRTGPPAKIPLSDIYIYAELLLGHQEILDAFTEVCQWWAQQTGEFHDCENDPTHPHQASNLLEQFEQWFLMKRELNHNFGAFRFAGMIAANVLTKKYKYIRSPQSLHLLTTKATRYIDLSR